jgi:hypothetical protein
MTRPTETYLRQEFASDAELAPLPHGLAEAARRRAGRSRARRYVLAAAAVVLLVAAAGVAVRLSPSVSTSLPSGDPTLSGPTAVLSLHGVEVTVPARMIGGGPCTVDRDVAYATTGGVYNCPMEQGVGHPERLTQIVLTSDVSSFPGVTPGELPRAGTRTEPDGRTQTVVVAKDRAARVIITTPDAGLAQAVAASLRLVDSPDGCALQDLQDRPHGVSRARLVTGTPTGGALCAYDQGWIVTTHALTGSQAVTLGKLVDAAPRGFGAPGPSCPDGYDYLDGYAEPHWTATLHGATTGARLWVYGGVCTPAAVSNEDASFAALTPELRQGLGRLMPDADMVFGTVGEDDPVMLCRAGAPGEHVDVAYGTTVADVRQWREGPIHAPAGGPWPQLDGNTAAAWCATTSTQHVTRVFAAAVGGPPLTYATDVSPDLLSPSGPTLR